jgi:hypothetical protein
MTNLPQGLRQAGPTGAVQHVYRAPNPNEVYFLPDAANAAIPLDIREQFQTDSQGRVLFFTAPPVPADESRVPKLKHSAKYLAFKAQESLKRKSKELDEDASAGAEKSPLPTDEETPEQEALSGIAWPGTVPQDVWVEKFNHQMEELLIQDYKTLFPNDSEWKQALLAGLENIRGKIVENMHKKAKLQEEQREAGDAESKIFGLTNLMDYKPPNEQLEWGKK